MPKDQNPTQAVVCGMEEKEAVVKGRRWAPRTSRERTDCVQSKLPEQASAFLLSGQRTERAEVMSEPLETTQQGREGGRGKALGWVLPSLLGLCRCGASVVRAGRLSFSLLLLSHQYLLGPEFLAP